MQDQPIQRNVAAEFDEAERAAQYPTLEESFPAVAVVAPSGDGPDALQGGFAHGLGAALFEELVHDREGNFVTGSFAEYLCPTAPDMPVLNIGHVSTPSPRNLTGAKGMGDGSSMLAPAALANAAADALGREDIELPLTLNRVWALANEPAHAAGGGS